MACFLAPTTEAIIMTIVKKSMEKKELQKVDSVEGKMDKQIVSDMEDTKIPFSRKLGWLNKMLWGGSFLLCIEHIWHGEVVPWFPFLTAMNNPADIMPMLKEIATVGVSMAVLVTAVWAVMVLLSDRIAKRTGKANVVKVTGE